MKTTTRTPRKRRYAILIITIILLVCFYFIYIYISKNTWPFQPSTSPATNSTQEDTFDTSNTEKNTEDDTIPTKEEASDDGDKSSSSNSDNSGGASGKDTVSVVISYATVNDERLEIRAFTPSVIESSGICSIELTRGTKKITKSSKAFIDATSTQCEAIYVPTTEIPESGTWKLVVTYTSSTSTGVSDIQEVIL